MEVEDRRRRRRNVGLSKRVEDESKWSSSSSGRRNAGFSKRLEEESMRSLGGGRRNVSLSNRMEEESRSSLSGKKRNVSLSSRIEEESGSGLSGRYKGESSGQGGDKIERVSKGLHVDFEEDERFERSSGEKRSNGRNSSIESNSKLRSETTRVEFSGKDSRKREETGMLLRADSHGGRKGGSSSSSYHSLSSSGDFDARNNHGLLEEPGSSMNTDSPYDRDRYNERIREEHKNDRDDTVAGSQISKHTSNVVEGSGMWDWRKKSEKKFTEVAIDETHASKKSSELHSRVMKTNESELAKASRSQKQYDDERRSSDQAWGTKEQYSQTGNQVLETESRRTFQEGKEKSELHRTDTETTSRSQQKRSDKDQNLATSTTTVQETSDEHYRKNGRITQREDINIDIQKFKRISQVQVVDTDMTFKSSTRISTFQEKDSGEPSSFQASASVVSQSRMQREDADNRLPEAPMLTPHPQLITRGPVRVQLSSETASQDESNSVVICDSSGGNSNTEIPVEILYPGNPDASTSEDNGMETVPEAQWGPGGEMRRTPSQYVPEDSQLKRNESRRASRGSGSKGPSIEMWDVTETDTPTLKSQEEENQVATTTGEKSEAGTASEKSEATIRSGKLESITTGGNVVAKRTGRSIWNLVGDIVKMRWSPRAETNLEAVRSGENIISTESVSSEAWLSGRETEGSSESNVKWDSGLQPETTPDHLSQAEKTSSVVKGKEKVRYLETGMTSSEYKEGRTLTSGSVSLSSGKENSSPKYFETNLPGSSSGIQLVELSQPQVATGVKSPVVKEISNAGYTVSGSSSEENKDHFGQKFDEELDNVQNTELKRRKLQRNKQVPKDRFDEWEEAHTREMEQRKNDEFFMREALVEAKKAAGTWEVPVGAVLVQHGKIIARGFNLVEELRDSTAHAEMICIREASNVLRTWRLAECTLYVTLEPCPMCAGAIYQARVDTVVWGAPNKLLGADGSWIRLFPDGGQRIESERSNKPAAPVHPFHPNITIRRGVLASECADIMQQFFQLRRRKKEKQSTPPAPESTHIVAHHPWKILTKLHDIFHVMFCL